jgi:hypothetical protein
MSPVVARLPMAWSDSAYKHARRAGHAAHLRAGDERTMRTWEAQSRRSPLPAEQTWPDVAPPSASWDDPRRYPWQ